MSLGLTDTVMSSWLSTGIIQFLRRRVETYRPPLVLFSWAFFLPEGVYVSSSSDVVPPCPLDVKLWCFDGVDFGVVGALRLRGVALTALSAADELRSHSGSLFMRSKRVDTALPVTPSPYFSATAERKSVKFTFLLLGEVEEV